MAFLLISEKSNERQNPKDDMVWAFYLWKRHLQSRTSDKKNPKRDIIMVWAFCHFSWREVF